MSNELTNSPHNTFENLRKVNASGGDYWSARELGKTLGYSEYRNSNAKPLAMPVRIEMAMP
jgi:hypothetical protein